MYLRAGLISLALLILSRVLGLLRESVQASAFGVSPTADAVVTMLTFPDIASAVFASGALSYAMLPWWARQKHAQIVQGQRLMAHSLLACGLLVCGWIWLDAQHWAQWLLPALMNGGDSALALTAVRGAALALPMAFLSAVWYTRLQHEGDAVGMYGMNVVHTGVIVAAMLSAGLALGVGTSVAVWLAGGLLAAFALRLVFLSLRVRRADGQTLAIAETLPNGPDTLLPPTKVWLLATLAVGLPAALPLVARSLASHEGAGALATFNYAWKLVELPNLLAIQLVATLAFPALTKAFARGLELDERLRIALSLSWVLACAAVLGLVIAAQPLAAVLYGWGKMGPAQVQLVAAWTQIGAWALLPLALLAVLGLIAATLSRLLLLVFAYALALLSLVVYPMESGQGMLLRLVLALCAATVVCAWGLRAQWLRALRFADLGLPFFLCVAGVALWKTALMPIFKENLAYVSVIGSLFATILLVLCVWQNPVLRGLRRRSAASADN